MAVENTDVAVYTATFLFCAKAAEMLREAENERHCTHRRCLFWVHEITQRRELNRL